MYKRQDISILENRRYEDYLNFVSKHPKMSKVQLDTVIGKTSNKKVLLTMYLVDTHFMLIFLLDTKTSKNVTEVFKTLKRDISVDLYRKIFRIILTDNGSEFYNPCLLYTSSISTKFSTFCIFIILISFE